MPPIISKTAAIEARLAEIRGTAKRRSPNVRVLAAYAGLSECKLASLGFAARVDFDSMLEGTRYEAQFGQSPFAFQRGNLFEHLLRKDDYAATREVLRGLNGFAADTAKVVNLRKPSFTADAMSERAQATKEQLALIVKGTKHAPGLIDGAVFETWIGGLPARFEADAVAARGDGLIHAGEVKSFPVVDGRGDPDKIGSALDQVAVYILLMKQVIAELGGDPESVSDEALLITPRNVSLRPTLSRMSVHRKVRRIKRLLETVPSSAELVDTLPTGLGFAPVADTKADEGTRIEALRKIAVRTGTAYGPGCMSSCGNARFCRAEAFSASKPCLVGPQAVRQLIGIESLTRAADLADGARASTSEQPAADPLARATRLHDLLVPSAKGTR